MGERPNTANLFSLKIDGISEGMSQDTLRETFAKFGEIGDTYSQKLRDTYESWFCICTIHCSGGSERCNNRNG